MYFDNAEGMVFRPPSEANSFILRVTVGCAHNRCTFCGMYNDVRFRTRPMPEILAQITQATRHAPALRRVFLADGNALCLKTETLLAILAQLRQTFPKLSRVTCYGGPQDILRKSPAELAALKEAGLGIIYLGIESGDDTVLAAVEKGATSAEMVTAGRKVLDAGIKLSTMVIIGLGGKERTMEHALNTAKTVNAINPTMLSALTLMLHEGTPLRAAADAGRFTPLSPHGIILELKEMIRHINLDRPCIFRSNHSSNLLPLAGTLPADKEELLKTAEAVQALYENKNTPTYNTRGVF